MISNFVSFKKLKVGLSSNCRRNREQKVLAALKKISYDFFAETIDYYNYSVVV